ncbi:MAG TPA: alkene reductase [Burkholderiaceae bacterium]|nr:alkene reductase [Burkholderiaceae bacterium]
MTRPDRSLFLPVRLGPYELPHRVVMAPMTRRRAQADRVPDALQATYYGQRCSGGLIVTEATIVSPQGAGSAYTPGIYTDEQIAGWQLVTKAVHDASSRVFLQLWHVGRQSHPSLQPGGALPVAPSAIAAQGSAATQTGPAPFITPRALELHEIPGIVEQFRRAALNALAAGFDGVEIHGANGFLLDQFLLDGSNRRQDRYGGSIENRARLLFEVTEAVASVWGAGRVGVRLSPNNTFGSMSDSDPTATYRHVVQRLDDFGLAYLHVIEPRISGNVQIADVAPVACATLRPFFRGTLIVAGGFDGPSAEAILRQGEADMVAFGRLFISNPDLTERIRNGWPLTPYDRQTFYSQGPCGYIDYHAYEG